jgi:hypothetical protein
MSNVVYKAKTFDLSGLTGISDGTLADALQALRGICHQHQSSQ